MTKQIVGVIDGLATKVFNPSDDDNIAQGERELRGRTPIRNRLTANKPKHRRSDRYRWEQSGHRGYMHNEDRRSNVC
ncbi:hypothetical protein [Brevundimonas sp. G8]|uniref:hypothetical protein n=1 Tax=Brevundimonas sp. G8 TaxID=1350776 RepID=UPI001356EFC1|nr:hypothetical protein [Brevundimonas sp. G8]